MNNRTIITLPVNPYGKMSVGRMTTPILGESLGKSMDSQFIMSVNLLSSFEKRTIEGFYELMKQYNINPDYYWVDQEHIDELINKIYYLIEKGYISEKESEILRCDCGKIELNKDNLNTINLGDSLLEKIDDDYYCKFCKSKCNTNTERVLVFNSRLVDKSNMKFYPEFINKDKTTFDKTVGNNDIVISRDRNTGINLEYNNHNYNIDVDFLWEIYLSLFDVEEKIVMCCNRQLYQLYMVGMLEKCFNNTNKTVCLATPYLEHSPKEEELQSRILSLKMFSLLVMKWAKKDNTFEYSLLKYLNTMNVEKKQKLYDTMLEEINVTDNISNDLKLVLTKQYNLQNSLYRMKKGR